MNKPVQPASAASFSLDDVYYTLFRHKWKILVCSLLGFLTAGATYVFWPKLYTSEAVLLIRYIQEGKGPTSAGDDAMRSPDARGGEMIVGAEAQIIMSMDLVQQVVDQVGPERILAKAGGGNDRGAAAAQVFANLNVDIPKKSSLLNITYANPDPIIAQPVLTAVVDAYYRRHLQIHRPAGSFDDFLTQQTDQMRARLSQTEEELRKARAKAGIISLEDTRKAQSAQTIKLREELFKAEAELAERNATIQQMLKYVTNPEAKAAAQPDAVAATNANQSPAPVENYKNLLILLTTLRHREQELLLQFTAENTRVKTVRDQITEAEEAKAKLETSFPQLVNTPQPSSSNEKPNSSQPGFDFNGEYGRIAAMETRIKVLNGQIAQVRAESAALDEVESNIQELERRRALEESNYKTFSKNLENARVDEALGVGRVTNISRLQNPCPPYRAQSKQMKFVAGLGAAGIALGLAWAFLIELLVDSSVRRPGQLEKQLGIEVFMSIPAAKTKEAKQGQLLLAAGDPSESKSSEGDPAPASPSNALRPYYAGLRDRMIGFFDNRNLNHKPRLVALTGMGADRGAAEIAAGLAGCLSETGEGNVLFVDMTTNQGAAHQFYKGKPMQSLDEVIGEKGNAEQARVADNLYVVGSGDNQDEKLPRILPKRFSHLVPKLRASDFDYIIFNMPPVNNTSPTPRLAGFMDVVLMVVESEKTQTESVEKAKALLGNNRAHIAAILNNTKNYIPEALKKEEA